jgi:hypothetical protein
VRKHLQTVVIVIALILASGAQAAADPLPVPDASRSVDTVDGFHFSASLTNMTINSVPNMAATAFTRESFVSGTATASVDDNGTVPVNTVKLTLIAQVGCQVDMKAGGVLSLNGESSGSVTDITGLNPLSRLDPGGNLNLLPGYIEEVPIVDKTIAAQLNHFDVKDLAGHQFQISADEFEVKVNRCAGPVTVRLVAQALMSTDNADKSVTVYSDIFSI